MQVWSWWEEDTGGSARLVSLQMCGWLRSTRSEGKGRAQPSSLWIAHCLGEIDELSKSEDGGFPHGRWGGGE